MIWETIDRYAVQNEAHGRRCLIFDGHRKSGPKIVMSRGFKRADGSIDWDNNGQLDVLKPTHWMALPDEPEGWKGQALLNKVKSETNYALIDLK